MKPCPDQYLQNGICVNVCDKPNYVENEGVCECGLNFQNFNGICCAEGEVNQNGECKDRCEPNYIESPEKAGICECAASAINFNGLCCAEGQVNEGGVCRDQCNLPNYIDNLDTGICDCAPNFYNIKGLCCEEDQVSESNVCEDQCKGDRVATNRICGDPIGEYFPE